MWYTVCQGVICAMALVNVFKQMILNIFKTDWIVFLGLLLTIWSLRRIMRTKSKLKKKLEKMPDNPDWVDDMRRELHTAYSIFAASITLYPLLGMFGTVVSLINVGSVDFSQMTESLDAVKSNFFTALTSTAWGIIFAAVLKIFNAAFIEPEVEDDLDRLDEIAEEQRRDKKVGLRK